MEWEFGVSRGKLLHLEQINNKVLLYSSNLKLFFCNNSCFLLDLQNSLQQWFLEHGPGNRLEIQILRLQPHLPKQRLKGAAQQSMLSQTFQVILIHTQVGEPLVQKEWDLSCLILRKKLKNFFGYAARHVGSQFPDQGLNPCPLHWKCGVLTTGPPGKSPLGSFET